MSTQYLETITGLCKRYMLPMHLKFSALAMLAMLLFIQTDGRRIVPMKFAKYFTNQALAPFSQQRVGGVSMCASLCGPTMQECVAFRLVNRGEGYKDCLLYNSLSYSILSETADADSVTVYVTRDVSYIGCFADSSSDRDLPQLQSYNDNKAEKCIETCTLRGYDYAGLEEGISCYCGQSYGKHGQLSDSECNAPCPGDSRQSCGGSSKISIYSTGHTGCHVGYYLNPMSRRCFKLYNINKYWPAAKQYCNDLGESLITFPSYEAFDWFNQFNALTAWASNLKFIGLRETSGQWKWEGLTIGNVSTSDPGWYGHGSPDGLRPEDDGFGAVYPGREVGYIDDHGRAFGFYCEKNLA